jgi:hypothetical protein
MRYFRPVSRTAGTEGRFGEPALPRLEGLWQMLQLIFRSPWTLFTFVSQDFGVAHHGVLHVYCQQRARNLATCCCNCYSTLRPYKKFNKYSQRLPLKMRSTNCGHGNNWIHRMYSTLVSTSASSLKMPGQVENVARTHGVLANLGAHYRRAACSTRHCTATSQALDLSI